MKINLNGGALDVPDGLSVGDLVRARAADQRRVAVARNGEVVPRGKWDATGLVEGDQIELLAPVAGG
jgi:sulfur carrier protein